MTRANNLALKARLIHGPGPERAAACIPGGRLRCRSRRLGSHSLHGFLMRPSTTCGRPGWFPHAPMEGSGPLRPPQHPTRPARAGGGGEAPGFSCRVFEIGLRPFGKSSFGSFFAAPPRSIVIDFVGRSARARSATPARGPQMPHTNGKTSRRAPVCPGDGPLCRPVALPSAHATAPFPLLRRKTQMRHLWCAKFYGTLRCAPEVSHPQRAVCFGRTNLCTFVLCGTTTAVVATAAGLGISLSDLIVIFLRSSVALGVLREMILDPHP